MSDRFVDPAVAGERFHRLKIVTEHSRSAAPRGASRSGRGGPRRGSVEEEPGRDLRSHAAEQARPLRPAVPGTHRQLRDGRGHARGAAPSRGSIRRTARRTRAQGAHPSRRAVTDPPRRIAVVGPTASGKSAVALAVAEQLGHTELLSIDSMQVYRGMDIGTAKPSPAERARVPHHLLDLVDPSCDFTVAEFQREYRLAAADIAGRGQRAILVGGTGLYHRAVVDDLDLPGEWPAIRVRSARRGGSARTRTALRRDSPRSTRRQRRRSSPPTRAASCARSRCARAAGVRSARSALVSTSIRRRRSCRSASVGTATCWRRGSNSASMRCSTPVSSTRCACCVPRGLSRTAAQALGYKEILAHLDGAQPLSESVEQIVVRTRQFAVRQLRWFQRDPRVRWVDVAGDPVAESGPIVAAALDA